MNQFLSRSVPRDIPLHKYKNWHFSRTVWQLWSWWVLRVVRRSRAWFDLCGSLQLLPFMEYLTGVPALLWGPFPISVEFLTGQELFVQNESPVMCISVCVGWWGSSTDGGCRVITVSSAQLWGVSTSPWREASNGIWDAGGNPRHLHETVRYGERMTRAVCPSNNVVCLCQQLQALGAYLRESWNAL